MQAHRVFPLLAIAVLCVGSLRPAQSQSQVQPPKEDAPGWRESGLNLVVSPRTPYPQKELEKIGGKGKVTLKIVVDENGRVSDAQALTGPPELFPAALENVKHWEFEPPAHPPVVTNVEIGYAFPVECPGAIANIGDIVASGRLFNKEGEVVGVPDGEDYPMPPYPDEEIKAGHSGDMVLAVRLDAQGKVKKIRVLHSLSTGLDRAAMKTFRKWRFKLTDENPSALRKEYQLRIPYRTMCNNLP
jgi:TonB family protein